MGRAWRTARGAGDASRGVHVDRVAAVGFPAAWNRRRTGWAFDVGMAQIASARSVRERGPGRFSTLRRFLRNQQEVRNADVLFDSACGIAATCPRTVTELDPTNIPQMASTEQLARYILFSKHFRSSDNTVKPDALSPHPPTGSRRRGTSMRPSEKSGKPDACYRSTRIMSATASGRRTSRAPSTMRWASGPRSTERTVFADDTPSMRTVSSAIALPE